MAQLTVPITINGIDMSIKVVQGMIDEIKGQNEMDDFDRGAIAFADALIVALENLPALMEAAGENVRD